MDEVGTGGFGFLDGCGAEGLGILGGIDADGLGFLDRFCCFGIVLAKTHAQLSN